MAIIGAIVGGVIGSAIIGAALDEYSDYSDYSNYSDYSDYSDHAEREKQRQAQRMQEIAYAKEELEEYAEENLDPFLWEHGISVDNYDKVDAVLKKRQQTEIDKKNKSIVEEIQCIDALIEKINKFTQ